ncbi:MAG: Regulatory protein AtoC [Myxococcota bacterium]|nr:Regulatory protein AtoC [Myxococcota bacterium]
MLVVDDEDNIRHMLSVLLRQHGYEVDTAANGKEALEALAKKNYNAVMTDIRMPVMDGMQLLREMKARRIPAAPIVLSAHGAMQDVVEAIRLGAVEYLLKPFDIETILLTLKKAWDGDRLRRENAELRTELKKSWSLENIIARSAQMTEILRLVRKVAAYPSTVLILGESGVGKEQIARALHNLSPRKGKELFAINCAAIPETLLESELFGHVRGAFTDAHKDRKGLFEAATGSTLFLDEIGELPQPMQVKLLRVLQEGEIRPVGGTGNIPVDVRIVAATSRDLRKEVEQGRFRQDLFYRLNVLVLQIPPLRERPEDIPLLAEHFLKRLNARLGANVQGIHRDAMKRMMEYNWPGNVRELENTIERAILLSDGEQIMPADMPSLGMASVQTVTQLLGNEDLSIKKAARILEIELIRKALKRTNGNRTRAAELLELSHRALLYKIREYGLDQE